MPRALISFVGAGPGDPELITLKALRRLREADVSIPAGRVRCEQALLLADRAAAEQLAAEYKQGG